jgi:hypothetical protein
LGFLFVWSFSAMFKFYRNCFIDKERERQTDTGHSPMNFQYVSTYIRLQMKIKAGNPISGDVIVDRS